MAHPTDSLYPVKKEDVAKAARNALAHVKVERKRLFGCECGRLIKRREAYVAAGLGWLTSVPTMEEAEKIVKALVGMGEYTPWKDYGFRVKYEAEDMLQACKVVIGDTVYLTVEDAALVSEYLDRG